MTTYIATDFTGVLTGVEATTMYKQFEHLHQQGRGIGATPLEDYLRINDQYGATSKAASSDHALKEWFETMGTDYNFTRDDFKQTLDTCFEDGTINENVVSGLITLARDYAKRIVIVSKNPRYEVECVADKINERAGEQVIYGVIGSELEYDPSGKIVGVKYIVSDNGGSSIEGTERKLKSELVKSFSDDYHFISDEKDRDIAKVADARGNKSVLLRHTPNGQTRDPYFARSPDYQISTQESGAYNITIENDKNVTDNLVSALKD